MLLLGPRGQLSRLRPIILFFLFVSSCPALFHGQRKRECVPRIRQIAPTPVSRPFFHSPEKRQQAGIQRSERKSRVFPMLEYQAPFPFPVSMTRDFHLFRLHVGNLPSIKFLAWEDSFCRLSLSAFQPFYLKRRLS